jgi:hypothetical protein
MDFLADANGLLFGGHTSLECGVYGHRDAGNHAVRHLLRSGGVGHTSATPGGAGSGVDDVVEAGV